MTKFARYQAHDGPRLAEVVDGELIDLAAHGDDGTPTVARDLADVIGVEWRPTGGRRALEGAHLLAPHARPPRNVLCVGKNYREHVAEFTSSGFDHTALDGDGHEFPFVVFTKPWTSIVGPGAPIEFDPLLTTAIDYEVELAVVIGRGGRNVPVDRALEHVFGYTVINDVTARDLQQRHRQWFIGKSLDSFCPMGPFVVTADALEISDLRLETRVNGELRQSATTADLIYDVPTIISRLSMGMALLPGDVIATGTPAGVGIGFDPPKYMTDGDLVSMTIDGIGELINTVRFLPEPSASVQI
jgi:2-keto-4-pentenoate hydratase/2-oxohepta-3-ene-1,7-dioic acid hydratase in catechol pathway